MSFDFNNVVNTEFGVTRGRLSRDNSVMIPAASDVKVLLTEMLNESLDGSGAESAEVETYEPSQTYGAEEKTSLPLDNILGLRLAAFYQVNGFPIDSTALDQPSQITMYFGIFYDGEGNKLVAIKRASAFKAVLRQPLIRWVDDSLKAIGDSVFKLDHLFDVCIFDEVIHIMNPKAFELMAEIDEAVSKAAGENTKMLEARLPYCDFATIHPYVLSHKRAQRSVAALRDRQDISEISRSRLLRECKRCGVALRTVAGKLCPDRGAEMDFLKMLDRRRYALSLIQGRHEQFEASSRRSVGVRERETGSVIFA